MTRTFMMALLAALAPLVATAQPSPTALDKAAAAGSALPRLRSLLVSHEGKLVLERYYNGARAGQLANIKSASKSIVSTLVGIAIAQGHIKGLDEPIAHYFPELATDRDRRKATITIGDLVSMRSGLESTSGRNYGAWVTSRHWVRYVLGRPLIAEPGTKVEYSTGTSHLLSAILTKATGLSTWRFAQQQLARPLGFTLARWPQDPQGIFFGGNEMLMTPRQMAMFGELYLNGGRVGEQQLLPRDWIEQSFVPSGRSRWGNDREYAHGWWIRELGGRKTFYAWGYGGQFVFVIPDARMVVVTTSRSDVSRERRDHNDAIYAIVEGLILQTT